MMKYGYAVYDKHGSKRSSSQNFHVKSACISAACYEKARLERQSPQYAPYFVEITEQN